MIKFFKERRDLRVIENGGNGRLSLTAREAF